MDIGHSGIYCDIFKCDLKVVGTVYWESLTGQRSTCDGKLVSWGESPILMAILGMMQSSLLILIDLELDLFGLGATYAFGWRHLVSCIT